MANRYRQSARANSGDWKFEVRDRPANWPRADPFPTVSDLHGRKGRGMRAFAPVMTKSPISGNAWLGREDSNLRMAESKSAALPLGYAPMRRKARTALAESGADNSSGSPAPQWPRRTKFAPAEGSPRTPNALNQEQCAWSRDAPRHPVLKRPDFVLPPRGVRRFAIGVASLAHASSEAGSRSDRFSVDIAGGR